jgi:hypothetical protein
VWNTFILIINTYDIETLNSNGKVIPYCIAFYLNNEIYTLYYNKKNIIVESLNIICENSDNSFIEIYVHNLNFDGLIIIEYISKSFIKFELLIDNTNLFYLDIYYMEKQIRFRCSYKLVPYSLSKIGEIEKMPKLFFPYKFVNIENIFYIGEIPSEEY